MLKFQNQKSIKCIYNEHMNVMSAFVTKNRCTPRFVFSKKYLHIYINTSVIYYHYFSSKRIDFVSPEVSSIIHIQLNSFKTVTGIISRHQVVIKQYSDQHGGRSSTKHQTSQPQATIGTKIKSSMQRPLLFNASVFKS